MALKKMKVNVRTLQFSCFAGEKIPGGTLISKEEFKKRPDGFIMMTGTLDGTDQNVQVKITRKNQLPPVYLQLVDDIEREGILEVYGELKESIKLANGEEQEYFLPRIENIALSDDKGHKNFSFTPHAIPDWVKPEYKDYKVDPINYGTSTEDRKNYAELRKASRKPTGSM